MNIPFDGVEEDIEDIIPEPVKGEWSRCETCKHFCEAHDDVPCTGDYEGDSCDCTKYVGKIIE